MDVNIYNVNGTLVRTVFSGNIGIGNHSIDVETAQISEGILFCKLITDSGVAQGKVVKIR